MSQENITNEIVNQETRGKRKDWIKNAAIVFLSVMLVLTFFSNTIMNYSLPEVATAWVESGSINAKIRGTGVLTSDDPYKISIQESRTIASVAVKAGDTVEKDQVLFYLEDKDSTELAQAEKELNDLILAYTKEILNGTISSEAYNNVQNGNISSTGAYQARIEAARTKYESAVSNANNIKKQIELLGNNSSSMVDLKTELANAELKLADYVSRRTEAKAALDSAKAELEKLGQTDTSKLTSEYEAALQAENTAKATYKSVEYTLYTTLDKYYGDTANATADEYNAIKTALFTPDGKGLDFEKFVSSQTDMDTLIEKCLPAKIMGVLADGTLVEITAVENLNALQGAYKAYNDAKANTAAANQKLTDAANGNDPYTALSKNVANLQQAFNEIDQKHDNQEDYVNNLKNQITNGTNDTTKQTDALNRQLVEAQAAQDSAKKEYDQLLTDISSELNLSSQNSIIREKQEEIAKLREKASGAVITAPVAGIVTNIYKTAGENTSPDEELAIMQPEGKGYSMNVSVTEEQARKVTVGDIAEVQNSWYYSDLVITLTGIRPDPENPGRNKLLVFNVTGDVQAGQSLNISIGQKSASYDMLVPNSAVREDNNGKFIYIVESKNSPLGNRYIAVRTDVEVLASDDTKTAISAPLYGYEYVITTSTQPVEAGKQVRLAEN